MNWNDLRGEIDTHIEEKALELIDSGVPEREAWERARREFGNPTRIVESSREVWGWVWLEHLGQDLRYAFRTMASNRVFTLLAVVSLALGIGANTVIYSFMESILLRSLPVPEPESLVALNWNTPPLPNSANATGPREPAVVRQVLQTSRASYFDSQRGLISAVFPCSALEVFQWEGSPFRSVFAYMNAGRLNFLANDRTDVIGGTYVSGEYFTGLGLAPAGGRLVDPDDDRAGASPVAVLSYSYWIRRFGGDTGVIGQTVHVNKTPVEIVGVTPPEFFGVDSSEDPDLYLPLHSNLLLNASGPLGGISGWYTNPNFYWVEMMVRLKRGVTIAQAQAVMAPRFHNLVESTAATAEDRAVLPALLLKEGGAGLDVLRREYSKPLYLLMTLVGLMLAIACANIANLLLARSAARKREMAVRLSVGASRGRVIRQLLTESLLLASVGGVLGVTLAMGGIRFLTLLLANGRQNFTLRAELNWHVLGVTAGISVLAGVLFGLAPALRATRVDVLTDLKDVRGGSLGRTRRGWLRVSLGQALIVGQIAISLLLLVTAGLFGRTLSNLESIQVGFNRENLLLLEVSPQAEKMSAPSLGAFYQDLRERLARIPGVRDVTQSNIALLSGGSMTMEVDVPGAQKARSWFLYTGPSFFETMQIPILQGRSLNDRDRDGSPRVAVVNELFARTYFAGKDVIGRTFTSSNGRAPIEIVGVALNARYNSIKEDIAPTVYLPVAQAPQPQASMTYEVRVVGDPMALAPTVQRLIQQIDNRVPVTRVRTQAAQIDQTINQEIVFARLCTGFAVLALLIACVGLYGTTTYNVARRTGEIGIRMALGAKRSAVASMVLRDVFMLAAMGVAISVPIALGTTKFVESFLFNVEPNDPMAFVLATATLLCAALAAAYVPARRASRVDPMIALRHE